MSTLNIASRILNICCYTTFKIFAILLLNCIWLSRKKIMFNNKDKKTKRSELAGLNVTAVW
ncbi:hypothetical protein X975_21144, partial [Stegodyphus mimosarum]